MVRMKSVAVLALCALSAVTGALAAIPSQAPDAGLVKRVLDDTATFWAQQFAQLGGHYKAPDLTLYSAQISGICGQKGAMSGAFYCPADQHLYLDPSALGAIGARVVVALGGSAQATGCNALGPVSGANSDQQRIAGPGSCAARRHAGARSNGYRQRCAAAPLGATWVREWKL